MLLDLVGMFSHRESSEVCSAVKPTGCQQFVWFHLQAGEARRRSALQVRRRRGAGRPVRSELEGSGRSEVGVAVSPSPAASSARSLRPNISPRLQRKQRRRAMSVTLQVWRSIRGNKTCRRSSNQLLLSSLVTHQWFQTQINKNILMSGCEVQVWPNRKLSFDRVNVSPQSVNDTRG